MIHLKLHVNQYILLLLTSVILFSNTQAITEQEISFYDESEQLTEHNSQSDTTQNKKPTLKESWHKVVTLRWKELSKADIWNIGTPIASISAISLFYRYWLINSIPNKNNHHSQHNHLSNNADKKPLIPTHNHNLNNNQNNLNILPNNNIPQATDIADFNKNEIFIDIQRNVALHVIADFLATPKILNRHNKEINAMITHNDKLITASDEGSVNIWNIDTGELLHVLEIPKSEQCIGVRKLKIKGNYLAIGFSSIRREPGNIIKIWNIDTYQLMHTFKASHRIESLTMNHDKIIVGMGGPGNGKIMIWDIHNGMLLHTFKAHDNRIMTLAIDDTILVTGSDDNTAKIWNINNYQLLHSLEGFNWWVTVVAIHDDKVITGSMDKTIKIWDKNNGQLLYIFTEHNGYINALAILNNKVISGSEDRTIKIWDINTGEVFHTLIGHTKGIAKIFINNNTILSTSSDSTRTWDINTGNKLYTISHKTKYDWHRIATFSRDTIITKSGNIVKIWPSYGDLNKPEFYDPEHALFWIKHNLLPLQANLIYRIYVVNTKMPFFIDTHSKFDNLRDTDDMYIWLTFPKHVRDYLMSQLKIKLIQISQ